MLRTPGSRRMGIFGARVFLAGCGGGGNEDDPPVAPTLAIDSDVPDVAEGRFTVRFQFSAEPHLPSGTIPFTRSGGSTVAGSFQKRSPTLYTVQIDPTPNTAGAIEVGVPKGAFADKTNTVSNDRLYSFVQAYDVRNRTGPTLVIISEVGSAGVATGPFVVTFTFDMDVGASFTADDVLVAPETVVKGPLVKESSTRYTMSMTPPSDTSGLVLIRVAEGAVSDAAQVHPSTHDASLAVFFMTP